MITSRVIAQMLINHPKNIFETMIETIVHFYITLFWTIKTISVVQMIVIPTMDFYNTEFIV